MWVTLFNHYQLKASRLVHPQWTIKRRKTDKHWRWKGVWEDVERLPIDADLCILCRLAQWVMNGKLQATKSTVLRLEPKEWIGLERHDLLSDLCACLERLCSIWEDTVKSCSQEALCQCDRVWRVWLQALLHLLPTAFKPLKSIRLNKRRQIQKTSHCMIPVTWNV